MPTPEEKLQLLGQRKWTPEDLGEFLGLASDQVASLDTVVDGLVDRFLVEKRLLVEGQTSLEIIALEYGVPTEPLIERMRKPLKGEPRVLLDEYAVDGRYLVPRRLMAAWIGELLPRNKVWSTLDSRARDLADRLNCDVRRSAVSVRFGENPAAAATCRCIATWDDVSRAHQEAVDNGKLPSLEPDHLGWHALYDHPDLQNRLWGTDITNFIEYVRALGCPWPSGA